MSEHNQTTGDTATRAGGGQITAWDAITSRRDVRDFEPWPIARADLEQILEAGRRSPSSRNWQPWDFVVVTERAALTELARVWQAAGHVARSAATIAVIGPAGDQRQRAQFDLGQATMSIMLAAASLGIGSGHSAVSDQELARRLLGFPEDKTCAFLIPLGYPAGRPLTPIRRPDRRPFDEVVHWGRW
jgi:nitroreductase